MYPANVVSFWKRLPLEINQAKLGWGCNLLIRRQGDHKYRQTETSLLHTHHPEIRDSITTMEENIMESNYGGNLGSGQGPGAKMQRRQKYLKVLIEDKVDS